MSDLRNGHGGLRIGRRLRIAALTRWCAILVVGGGMVVFVPLVTRFNHWSAKAAQGARKASPGAIAIAPFEVSVVRSVSLPNHQVPEVDDPFLGAAAHTYYNMAVVLQVTNTAPGVARLNDDQLKVQVLDDTNTRHDALGYTPIEISQAGTVEGRMQTSVDMDKKTSVITIKHIYTLSNGATVNGEMVIDSAGRPRWTLGLPPGKPTIVSCIFNIPSGRKAVNVALAGVKKLIPLPASPQTVR